MQPENVTNNDFDIDLHETDDDDDINDDDDDTEKSSLNVIKTKEKLKKDKKWHGSSILGDIIYWINKNFVVLLKYLNIFVTKIYFNIILVN